MLAAISGRGFGALCRLSGLGPSKDALGGGGRLGLASVGIRGTSGVGATL